MRSSLEQVMPTAWRGSSAVQHNGVFCVGVAAVAAYERRANCSASAIFADLVPGCSSSGAGGGLRRLTV